MENLLSRKWPITTRPLTRSLSVPGSERDWKELRKRIPGLPERDRATAPKLDARTILDILPSLTESNQIPLPLVHGFRSDVPIVRKLSARRIRRILGKSAASHVIQAVIDTDLVSDIVALLDSEDPDFQEEGSSIIANIVSGSNNQAKHVMEAGAIPRLIRLATSTTEDVADNSVWALANIIRDCAEWRDVIKEQRGIDTLANILKAANSSCKVKQTAVWALSSYIYSGFSPRMTLEKVEHLLPCITDYIKEAPVDSKSMNFLGYAVKALHRICSLGLLRSDLIHTGVVGRLVQLVSNPSTSALIKIKALRTLSYLVSGGDDDAQAAIDAGVVPALLVPITCGNKSTACRIAANIAVGPLAHALLLLEAGLLKPTIAILLEDTEDIWRRREACLVIANLTGKNEAGEVRQTLFKADVLQALCVALLIPDLNTRVIAVYGITNFLEKQPPEEAGMENDLIMADQATQGLAQKLSTVNLDENTIRQTSPSLAEDGRVPDVFVHAFRSNDSTISKLGLAKITKLIQTFPSRAVQPIIDTGLVPDIVTLLESDDPELQALAASTATNLACGTTQQTQIIVEAGAIPSLTKLAAATNEEMSDIAVWALANILADSGATRDEVENNRGMEAISSILESADSSQKVKRTAVWAAFCYLSPASIPKMTLSRAKYVLPSIAAYIRETSVDIDNMESIEYAVKALDRICNLNLPHSELAETEVVSRLVELVAYPSSSNDIKKYALRCLNHLVSGNDDDTQNVINAGVIPALLTVARSSTSELRYGACRIASNIAVGAPEQVQALVHSGFLEPAVTILLDVNADSKCRREACWVITNLTGWTNVTEVRQAVFETRVVQALLLDWRHPNGALGPEDSLLADLRGRRAPQHLRV
ncbi:Importin alpha subunit (Karyopherin alpha subunit) (Serine-rich RNA polymerase I suppressor protein), partial [Tulasnella sp. 427]